MDSTLYQFIGIGEPGGPQWVKHFCQDGESWSCRFEFGFYSVFTVNDPGRNTPTEWGIKTFWQQHFPCDSIEHGKALAAEHYRKTMTGVLREVKASGCKLCGSDLVLDTRCMMCSKCHISEVG